MLSRDVIEKQKNEFHKKFGINLLGAPQGSLEWHQSRLGVITASEISKAVAKVGTETRDTYLCKLVAEIATGVVEELNSKYLDWGKLHEPAARASYEFSHDCEIEQIGFVFKNDGAFREGCSLDGIVKKQNRILEIKCPYNPTNYVKFLADDKIKSEYMWQYQFQMRVTDSDIADFVQFDPRMKVMPFKILTVERDDEYQKKFDDLIPKFIADMDKLLKKLGIEYGDQWKRLAETGQQALYA